MVTEDCMRPMALWEGPLSIASKSANVELVPLTCANTNNCNISLHDICV